MLTKEILETVREAIRHPFSSYGCYPVYTVLADGTFLCRTCAHENYRQISESTRHDCNDGWKAIGADVLWETEDEEYCGHCNKIIESAYGIVEKVNPSKKDHSNKTFAQFVEESLDV